MKKEQKTKPPKRESSRKRRETQLQYHPPMCASMMLEFHENKHQIAYESEHNLNTKPNSIDFIIMKPDAAVMKSSLGAIFKRVNLVEYKSPKDALGKRVYYRTRAYIGLYIAYGKEDYSPEDFTVTFIREGRPVSLMAYLEETGYVAVEYEAGIYHLKKPGHIDMQIIVTGLLGKKYKWITKLTDRVEREDIESMMDEMDRLRDAQDLMNAESVLDLVTRLNKHKKWFEEMKGMGAFRDLFREEFEEKDNRIAELEERLLDKDEQLQSKDEQLQSKDEQLQSKDEQLQNKDEQLQSKEAQLQSKDAENTRLRQELEGLKKQMGRIAVF